MKAPMHIPNPSRVVDGFEGMAREEIPAAPEAWMEANLDLLTRAERMELVDRAMEREVERVEEAEWVEGWMAGIA